MTVITNAVESAPTGGIRMMVAVATLPTGWLLCNGAALSSGTYPDLFAVIGYAYGGAAGTFNLPDFTNRFPIGLSSTKAVASTGGESTHLLTTAELPVHTHSATVGSSGSHNHSGTITSGGAHYHNHDFGNVLARTVSSTLHAIAISPLAETGGSHGNGSTTTSSNDGAHTHTFNLGTSTTHTHGFAPTSPDAVGSAHNNLPSYLTIHFMIKA